MAINIGGTQGSTAGGTQGTSSATGTAPSGGVKGAVGQAFPQGGVLGAQAQGNLPFTGAFMWRYMLLGIGLLPGGIALRRSAEAL